MDSQETGATDGLGPVYLETNCHIGRPTHGMVKINDSAPLPICTNRCSASTCSLEFTLRLSNTGETTQGLQLALCADLQTSGVRVREITLAMQRGRLQEDEDGKQG